MRKGILPGDTCPWLTESSEEHAHPPQPPHTHTPGAFKGVFHWPLNSNIYNLSPESWSSPLSSFEKEREENYLLCVKTEDSAQKVVCVKTESAQKVVCVKRGEREKVVCVQRGERSEGCVRCRGVCERRAAVSGV